MGVGEMILEHLKLNYGDMDIYKIDDGSGEDEYWSISGDDAIRFDNERMLWVNTCLTKFFVIDGCKRV